MELRIFYRDRRISSSSQLEIMNFLRLLVKLLVKTQIFQKLSPLRVQNILPKIVERASWKTVKRRIFMMNYQCSSIFYVYRRTRPWAYAQGLGSSLRSQISNAQAGSSLKKLRNHDGHFFLPTTTPLRVIETR